MTVVFAALAVGRLVEQHAGWSIRRFVRTARRYRTVQIRTGQHLIVAADPIPADFQAALAKIQQAERANLSQVGRTVLRCPTVFVGLRRRSARSARDKPCRADGHFLMTVA
jgi:hypothetical protein